jgi:hypothetical protein
MRYPNGIICHRHPSQMPRTANSSAIEQACKTYHDLFGDMVDLEASVDEWNLKRNILQGQYFTELRRRYKEHFGQDMPAATEIEVRGLLSRFFGGLFLCY